MSRLLIECLFCGSKDHRLRLRASDRFHGVPGDYELHECCNCGLLFLNPQPESSDLVPHYPANYYAYSAELPPGFQHEERLYRTFLGNNSNPFLKIVELPFRHVLRMVSGGPGTKLLDIGCGAGYFLVITKRVLGVDAYGVEPFGKEDSFAAKNGVNIFHGTLEQAEFPSGFFDVVCMNHVLEHTPAPRVTLKEVRRILSPSGAFYVSVPHSGALLYRLFGKRWFPLEVPRHLFIPSIRNLQQLFADEGFVLKSARQHGDAGVLLRTLSYVLDDITGRHPRYDQGQPGRLALAAALPAVYLMNALGVADMVDLMFVPA
jgi:SAM-dependent methyltransferase